MLAVLRDGRAHSRQEIFRLTGCYFLTNNAASELRRQGFNVVSEHRDGNVYVYRLAAPAAGRVAA